MRYVETIENVVDAVDGANETIELDGRSLARDFRLALEVVRIVVVADVDVNEDAREDESVDDGSDAVATTH